MSDDFTDAELDRIAMRRIVALQQAVESAPYLDDSVAVDPEVVLNIATKYEHWIATGETPSAQFARVETERFFRAIHPSQRGPSPSLTIVDEIKDWPDADPTTT